MDRRTRKVEDPDLGAEAKVTVDRDGSATLTTDPDTLRFLLLHAQRHMELRSLLRYGGFVRRAVAAMDELGNELQAV